MRYLSFKILICFLAITSCKEDIPDLDCQENYQIIFNGDPKCVRITTGYFLDTTDGVEAISINIKNGLGGLNGDLSIQLAPNDLLEEGKNYNYQEGSGFTGAHLGSIESGNIRVLNIDREQGLLTIQFGLKGTVIPSNDSFSISGTFEDLAIVI
jgi:hypothetical protein